MALSRPPAPRKPALSPLPLPDRRPAQGPWRLLLGALTTAVITLGLRPLSDAARVKVHPRWCGHTPELARALATMMEQEPALFSWLSFSAPQLRARIDQVADLVAVQERLEEFVSVFTDTLYHQRGGLFDWASEAEDGLRRLLDSARLPPAQRQRLLDVSAPVRAIAERPAAEVPAAPKETIGKPTRRAVESHASRAKAPDAVAAP